MKKFVSVNLTIGMLMTLAVVTSAMSAGTPQPDQNQAGVRKSAAISGQYDKRIITPDMNYRERVETQRNFKKRAAAVRNQLIQAAEKERRQQAKTVVPEAPKLE
jgi:hypothetical protein